MAGRPFAALRVLRHRDYRLLWTGNFVANIASWGQALALAWLVRRSPVILGLIYVAQFRPILILSPFAGVAADRLNRRSIILASLIGAMLVAFSLAGLSKLDLLTEWSIVAVSAVTGVLVAFQAPAYQSLVPTLVAEDELVDAVTVSSAGFNLTRAIGPSLGAAFLAAFGSTWAFIGFGLSCLVPIGALTLIRPAPRELDASEASLGRHLLDGLAFVRQNRGVATLLTAAACIAVFGMPYLVLLPIMASEVLGKTVGGYGALMAASGFGAVVGAFTVARLARHDPSRVLPWTLMLFGVTLMGFAASRTFWLSTALLVPIGATYLGSLISVNSAVALIAGDRFRGRLVGLLMMVFAGLVPVGSMISAFLAREKGAPTALALGALGLITCGLVFAGLRRLTHERSTAEHHEATL